MFPNRPSLRTLDSQNFTSHSDSASENPSPNVPPESTRDGSRDFNSDTSPFPLDAGVNIHFKPLLSETKLGTQSLEHSQSSGEGTGVAPHSPVKIADQWPSELESANLTSKIVADQGTAALESSHSKVVRLGESNNHVLDEPTNVLGTAKVQNKNLLFPNGYQGENSPIGGSGGVPDPWESNHLNPQTLAELWLPRSKSTKRDTSQPKSARLGAEVNGGGTTTEPVSEAILSLWCTHYPELRMYIPEGTLLALTDLVTIRSMVIADREREASTTYLLLGRAVPGLVAAPFEQAERRDQGHFDRTGTKHHGSGGTSSFDRERQTTLATYRTDRSEKGQALPIGKTQGQASPSLSKKGQNSVDNDDGLFTTAQVNRLAEARSRSVEEFEAMKGVFRAANYYMINDVKDRDVHRSSGLSAFSIGGSTRSTSHQIHRNNINVDSDNGISPDSMASEYQQNFGRDKGYLHRTGVAPSVKSIQGISPYGSR